jgi:lipopolysaccharide export system permease protein
MKLYHRYILRKVALVLVMSAVVCSLSLAVVYMVRLGKDRNLGIPPLLMLRLMVHYNAFLAIYSVPISVLVASLLVFGRLTADNELTALRASGVAPVRVFSSTLGLGLVLSFVMLGLNGWAAPRSHAAFAQLRLDAFSLEAFFAPGRTISLKNYSLHIGATKGDGLLANVTVTVRSPEGRTTTIQAKTGEFTDRRDEGKVQLDLYDVDFFIEDQPAGSGAGAKTKQEPPTAEKQKGQEPTAPAESEPGAAPTGPATQIVREKARRYTIVFDFADIKSRAGRLTDKDDLTMRELLARRTAARRQGDAALAGTYGFEFNKRLVFSVAPLVFVFVGVPLGVWMHRGERGLGAAIAMAVAAAYYSVVLGIERGITSSSAVPSLLVWVPCVALLGGGVLLMMRVSRGR